MVKRTGSKESGASILVTGTGMREASGNPHPGSHVSAAHGFAVTDYVTSPQKDDLKYKSTTSSNDVRDKDKASKVTFAAHPLQIDIDGSFFVDEGGVEVYTTTFKTQVNKAPRATRRQSNAQFTDKYVANRMINLIQDRAVFEKLHKEDSHTKRRNMLDSKDGGLKKDELIKMIGAIADQAIEIFKQEPRVLKVNQPVIVFGDVHGNLGDLMVYERLFWKNFPHVLPWNYLFLGDYVDRSKYSLETILYLLCQKIVCKHKFFLLRGNHEFRNVNKEFSFPKELNTIFGHKDGQEMCILLNRVFDYMPMAAVISGRVFCCHGGVPSSIKAGEVCLMKELEAIPCPYLGMDPNNPAAAGPAWELVWNDPMDKDEFRAVIEASRPEKEAQAAMLSTGFATNIKRMTGKFFSETATRNFLNTNNFDYILRAHECVHHGYQTKHGGLTTTVFSSSGYSNNNNAAIIMVNDDRIRPARVKTSNDTQMRK